MKFDLPPLTIIYKRSCVDKFQMFGKYITWKPPLGELFTVFGQYKVFAVFGQYKVQSAKCLSNPLVKLLQKPTYLKSLLCLDKSPSKMR